MFSMEAFCYHREGLSKFGAPKRPLCFQEGGGGVGWGGGGGFKRLQTLTTRSALLTRLQTRRALAALSHRAGGGGRFSKPWSYSLRFTRMQRYKTYPFSCQQCILCWRAGRFHWSSLWWASPKVARSCSFPSPPFSLSAKQRGTWKKTNKQQHSVCLICYNPYLENYDIR